MPTKSRSHLILIGLGTLLSAFSLGCIVKFTDPYTSGYLTHAFFYLSFFMMSFGVCTIAGVLLRLRFAQGLYINHLAVSIRQGVLVSLLAVISLILQAKDLLFWWVGLTMILFFLSLEVFINTK